MHAERNGSLLFIETKEAYVIDAVLDYDAFAGTVQPNTAKSVLDYIQKHKLHVTKIIDTHVHAVNIFQVALSFYLFTDDHDVLGSSISRRLSEECFAYKGSVFIL